MYAKKRAVYRYSEGSRGVLLPPGTPCGKHASMVGDRLVWIDPSGRFSVEELLELVEEIEPQIWARLERAKTKKGRE